MARIVIMSGSFPYKNATFGVACFSLARSRIRAFGTSCLLRRPFVRLSCTLTNPCLWHSLSASQTIRSPLLHAHESVPLALLVCFADHSFATHARKTNATFGVACFSFAWVHYSTYEFLCKHFLYF